MNRSLCEEIIVFPVVFCYAMSDEVWSHAIARVNQRIKFYTRSNRDLVELMFW